MFIAVVVAITVKRVLATPLPCAGGMIISMEASKISKSLIS